LARSAKLARRLDVRRPSLRRLSEEWNGFELTCGDFLLQNSSPALLLFSFDPPVVSLDTFVSGRGRYYRWEPLIRFGPTLPPLIVPSRFVVTLFAEAIESPKEQIRHLAA